jgi:hypothetical protein
VKQIRARTEITICDEGKSHLCGFEQQLYAFPYSRQHCLQQDEWQLPSRHVRHLPHTTTFKWAGYTVATSTLPTSALHSLWMAIPAQCSYTVQYIPVCIRCFLQTWFFVQFYIGVSRRSCVFVTCWNQCADHRGRRLEYRSWSASCPAWLKDEIRTVRLEAVAVTYGLLWQAIQCYHCRRYLNTAFIFSICLLSNHEKRAEPVI